MNLFDLQATINLNTSSFESGINKAKASAKSLTSSVANIGKDFKTTGEAVSNFGGKVTNMGKKASKVTAALGGVFTAAFTKSRSFIGTYESAMAVFTKKLQGGKDAARDLYKSLLQVARGSSFSQEALVSAGQTLTAMGIDAQTTTKYVQIATNAIAGLGGSSADIKRLSELFGKLSQETTFYTSDVNQLITAGIPAWEILAQKYHTTKDAIKEMASKGLIPASEALETITGALTETNEASEMYRFTINGLAESLKNGTLTGTIDSLNTSFRTFSLRLLDLDPNTKSGEANIIKLNEAISKFGSALEGIGTKFNFVGKWFGDALEKITNAIGNFNTFLATVPEDKLQKIAKVVLSIGAAGPALMATGKGINSIGEAFSGIGSALEFFKGGISSIGGIFSKVTESFGTFKSFASEITPSLQQIGSGFGDLFSGIGTTVQNGVGKITEFLSPMTEKVGSVFSSISGKVGEFLGPIGEKVGSTFSGIASKIGETLGPIGDKVGSAFSSISSKAGEFLGPIGEKIGGGLGGILGKVTSFAPQMTSGFTKLFNIGAIAGTFLAGLGLLQENFGDEITKFADKMIDEGPEIIQNLAEGIVNALPQLMDKGSELLEKLIQVINTNLPSIIKAGVEILSSLVSGLAKELPTLIPMALNMIITLVESLLDNIDQLIDSGIELVLGLADGLVNAIPDLIEKIPILIEKLLTAITTNLPKLVETGIKLVVKLAVGLVKAIPQLVKKVPEILKALLTAFGKGFDKMKEVGKNLIKGLWNGIKNIKQWILDKISGFCSGIMDGIKGFFGIKSPSRLMRDIIGKNLALGIGVGFEEKIGVLRKRMNKDLKSLTDGLETQNITYDASVSSKTNEGLVNGLSSIFEYGNSDLTIKLTADGLTSLATVLYDPIRKVAQQKGVYLSNA